MGIQLKNNAVGYLATAITASDTGAVLQTGNGASFPALGAGDYFYATLESTGGTMEVVKATARSGDSLTVVRAQEGTTAQSFAAGSRFELRVTSAAVREALNNADGSSLVGFIQAGTSAVARTAQSKLREMVSVLDFGADPTASTDSTDAIKAAIAYVATLAGGTVWFPDGNYLVGSNATGADTELFLVTHPTKFVGGVSKLFVAPTVPNTTDIFRFYSSSGFNDGQGYEVSFLSIIPASTASARYAINLDSFVGRPMKAPLFNNLRIALDNGFQSIYSANGGYFGITISECFLRDGIYLNNAPDNVNIERNVISRANYGVWVDMETGSAALNIRDNNITNYGGSIYLGESTKANICNNNIEPRGSVVNATSSAITIAGPASATTISGNKITMLALSLPLVNGIYIDDAYSTTIMHNEWGISTLASMKAATITANADNTLFLANSTNADSTNLLDYIVSSGVRTQYMGFKKSGGGFEIRQEPVTSATLVNSWTNVGGNSANAGFFRDQFGIVHLVGAITGGTVGYPSGGAFTLPTGYRPPKNIVLPLATGPFTSPGRSLGTIVIDTAGVVYIETGNNTFVSLDSVSFRTY
jgi:hypothetical protein